MIEPARHTKIALLGSGSVMLWRCAEWNTSLVSFCDWLTDKQTNNCQHPWVNQPTRLIILQSAMTHLPGFAPPQGAVQRKTYLCLWQIPPARERRGLDSSGDTREHRQVQFFPSSRCANILAHDKLFPAVDKLEDATCIGISEVSGFASMPNHLYSSANLLATDFTGLVVSFMTEAAWDFSFWCDQWPNRFAGLMLPDTQQVTKILNEIKEQWKCLSLLEGLLVPNQPNTAESVEHQLVEVSCQHPELVTCLVDPDI